MKTQFPYKSRSSEQRKMNKGFYYCDNPQCPKVYHRTQDCYNESINKINSPTNTNPFGKKWT